MDYKEYSIRSKIGYIMQKVVIFDGTHNELMDKKGEYYQLINF
jgi:hypothetical protein